MSELPAGVVTFLFTDVEGSTRMWEESPDLMMKALDQHDRAIDDAVAAHNGVSVKPRGEGDSRFIVFTTAVDAVEAAAESQRALAGLEWATPRPLQVRMSLHTGTAELQLGDYYGSAVNRAARLRAIAHGGQTVMSRSTWELVQDQLPAGVTVRDMGEHGLKDLTRPEHVYQIDVEGLPDTFAPLTSLEAVPNNLPRQLTDLIGREAELAEAKRLLGETRLLTILAPGGTGKTRLGIQAAADLTADYPDGVFFVGLADVGSNKDIVQAVAESIGISLSSDEDPRTQLFTYCASKRQLLVFDNIEHLSEGASIVREILEAAPHVAVITTSRSKLNLSGETAMTLAGLKTTWETPDEAFQASGVRLFIDAAKRSQPGFVLDGADLDGLAEILRLTGGMPLGILLAAAWVDMLPVGEIASEIAKNLDFLETEMGDMPDRHRSVRAVFDYSWALLSEDERSTFAALSVFRGGFSREAAERVAGATLRNLQNLANKALVTPSPTTGRYEVHELLRQYAEDELQHDPDRYRDVIEAHAGFYGTLTEEAFELFFRGQQQLTTVEQDIENVRTAWRHCLATDNGSTARQLIGGLWILYELRGWYPAAVALFGEALDALDDHSDDEAVVAARAFAAALQAWFLGLVGQPDAGAPTAAQAVEALRKSTDLVAHWSALQCWALCLGYLGDVEEMIAATDEGIAVGERLAEPFWAAGLKNWRSLAAILGADGDTARRLLPEAMEVFEQLDEHFYMTWNLWLQAMLATQETRTEDAIDLHTRQVARAKSIGYLRGQLVAFQGLGEANLTAGNLGAAEEAFVESMATAEQMGMVTDMLGMLAKVATVRAALGQRLEAVELLATVLSEPVSSQLLWTGSAPITEIASEALAEVRQDLDREEFTAAHARGTARPFDVAVKELLTSRRS